MRNINSVDIIQGPRLSVAFFERQNELFVWTGNRLVNGGEGGKDCRGYLKIENVMLHSVALGLQGYGHSS